MDLVREHVDFLVTILPAAERRFQRFLDENGLGAQETKSIRGITLGAILNAIRSCYPSETVLEEIEYQARRLAKLQVDPMVIHAALTQFDEAILAEAERQQPQNLPVARMIVNHYHLFVTNVINVTLYQLWRGDSKLLEDLSTVEMAELSEKDLRARVVFLVKSWAGADAVAVHTLPVNLPKRLGRPEVREQSGETPRWSTELSTPVCIPLRNAEDPRVLATKWRSRYRSVWSFPITAGMRQFGVLQLAFTKSFEWLPSEAAVLLQVTERLGLALSRRELVNGLSSRESQVRQLATHLQLVEERERKRISRELHDEAGQSLLCLRLHLEMIEKALPKREKESRERIGSARAQVESIIVEIRRLLAALSPNVLEQFGLVAAIRHLLKEFLKVFEGELEVQIALPDKLEVSNATSMAIYRFLQECLHNILSHAEAGQVTVNAELIDDWLHWEVRDNGVGFDLASVQKHEHSFGLRGIGERLFLMGGNIEIVTAPGKGTSIHAQLPMRPDPSGNGLTALAHATASMMPTPVPEAKGRPDGLPLSAAGVASSAAGRSSRAAGRSSSAAGVSADADFAAAIAEAGERAYIDQGPQSGKARTPTSAKRSRNPARAPAKV
jgi:signal transduction histidine kinase